MTEDALDPETRARIRRDLDRLEERLYDDVEGQHRAGGPADDAALRAAALPESAQLLYARYDGIEVAMGEARLFALDELADATARAEAEGVLRPGDRVVGERGRQWMVLPEDPWAEGADVVAVDEDGDRRPEASTLVALVLGWLAEASVLYGDDGEFRDDVFADEGGLLPDAERKLLRRRLDVDPDAPHTRLRLAQRLRAEEKFRGALKEVELTLRRAPEYAWAHHEAGRIHAALGQDEAAARAHAKAAEHASDPALAAYFAAWAARRAPEQSRERFAQQVLTHRPDFVVGQIKAAQLRIDDDDLPAARELVALGLAVAPHNVELLDLQRRLTD